MLPQLIDILAQSNLSEEVQQDILASAESNPDKVADYIAVLSDRIQYQGSIYEGSKDCYDYVLSDDRGNMWDHAG